jgi:hypothetical protein
MSVTTRQTAAGPMSTCLASGERPSSPSVLRSSEESRRLVRSPVCAEPRLRGGYGAAMRLYSRWLLVDRDDLTMPFVVAA